MPAERYVGLSSDVGHVEGDPAARHQDPVRFREDSFQEAQILVQSQVRIIVLSDVVRR